MAVMTSLIVKRNSGNENLGGISPSQSSGGDIGQLIGTLFLSREIAHREHLKTRSFADHMALDAFYNGVVEIADSITEAYQGRNGIIDIPFVPNNYSGATIDMIQSLLDEVENMRYSAVDQGDTAIQNLIDEAVALFLSTLYKLKNLK
jgi:hypothetical protein